MSQERAMADKRLNLALIVDDHPLFCDALALNLRTLAGVARIESADRLETALARLDVAPLPDVILLDLHLPDVTGIDGLIRLKTAAGEVPVIVVSSLDEPRVIAAVFRVGASGFVPKHSARETFAAAVRRVHEGGIWLPEGYVPPPGDSDADEAFSRLALLTRQQARILHLLCEGRLNKQIAFDLSISEATVKAHVTAILRKLGVQSRTQAVLLAHEANFATLSPGSAGHDLPPPGLPPGEY